MFKIMLKIAIYLMFNRKTYLAGKSVTHGLKS